MIKEKKKNRKENGIRKKIEKLCPALQNDDIISAFEYNLHPDIPNKNCDGLVVVTRENITVFLDGEVMSELRFSDISLIKTEMGVGTVFVYCEMKEDNSPRLICLTNMTRSKEIIQEVKRLNRIVEYGIEDCPQKIEQISKNRQDGNSDKETHASGSHENGKGYFIKKNLNYIKRLWDIVKPYKWFLFFTVVFFIIICALNMISPEINRILTDDYINSKNGNVVLTDYVLVVLSMLVIQLVLRAISMLRGHILIFASSKMVVDLRDMLFAKIQRLSLSKISQKTAGDLLRRISQDVGQIENFLIRQLPNLIEQIFLFIAISIIFILNDLSILLILILLPIPLVFLSFSFFFRKIHKLFHKAWKCSSKSNSVLHDIFSGIRVVKSFGTEKREGDRYSRVAAEERDVQIKSDCMWYTLMPILQFLMCIGEFIILFYVGNQILGGTMTIGEMSKFSMYASMMYGPLRMFSTLPRQIMNFLTSTTKVFELMDEREEITDIDGAKNQKIVGNIDINHISFGYDSGKEVLNNVDLHIKSGEFIGVVGKSGVGKSTLINLIMRMYDVEEGNICIDGIDIRDIAQDCLRSQMGVVLQETFLFSGTIYQNIAYAKPDASREEIIAVSKLSGCHSFITKLPDGYDTKVGEKGYSLSGGERQRIAIARALLHDPKILILDEATASLDTETEKQIQDALSNLSANRTTIAIAHRLSTLRNANKIVVLDKGKVAEVGSHDELMQNQGIYYGLVMAQREMSKM